MFDLASLKAHVSRHGRVARVVIAAHEGSTPREVGASMIVWPEGQSGTVGGGALEWDAAARARETLAQSRGATVTRIPLGPALGQCCGGAVTLVTEVFDAATLPRPEQGVFARSLDGREMPLAVKRVLDRARGRGELPRPHLVQGWFVEPLSQSDRPVWVWGAGHVGRAIVQVLAPLPGLQITWVDVHRSKFPDTIPPGVVDIAMADAAELVAHAPTSAEHLILTYSHALDLDLCHRLLRHGFARCGLIGSATKWARFRSRLSSLGHTVPSLSRIDCPIGDPALGKHPQAIAIGVATALLHAGKTHASQQENAG